MDLSIDNVVPYLLGKGQLSPSHVVAGPLTVTEHDGRNRSFRVATDRDGHGICVKQVKTRIQSAMATIEREAAFYAFLKDVTFSPETRRVSTVAFRLFDRARCVLLLELFPSTDLGTYRWSRASDAEETAALVGQALAACHSLRPFAEAAPALSALFERQLPWILDIGQEAVDGAPVTTLRCQIMFALAQFPFLLRGLPALRSRWEVDSLIHGDFKWNNCLVARDLGRETVRIIDWELADLGDGAWDLAMFLRDCTLKSVFESPDTVEPTPRRLLLAPFWRAYADARGIPPERRSSALRKVVAFSAACLASSVLEYAQEYGRVDAPAFRMLETSQRILQEPNWAMSELYALEP